MVDCGNARCCQERRSFRKELLSWSKKVPIAVGLETIAAELGSKDVMKTLFLPFNELESQEVQDWEPSEKCFYCKDTVKLLFEAIESIADDARDGRAVQENPSLRYLTDILPFCPQFYTQNFGREILAELKSGRASPADNDSEMSVPHPSSKCNTELKIPMVTASKLKKDSAVANGKKAYTDNELSAAVSDIRSGKLGTRRAAVLYGIPRSTLRNKIFKMGDETGGIIGAFEEEGSSNESGVPSSSAQQENTLQLADLLQISTLQYLAPIAMPFTVKEEHEPAEDDEWEKKLQQIRHKHNLTGAPISHIAERVHGYKLKPFLYDLIKKLAQERLEMEQNASRVRTAENASCKSNMSKQFITKALNNEHMVEPAPRSTNTSPIPSSIKVPSYHPAKSQAIQSVDESLPHKLFQQTPFKYENTKIGDTLKDIIVKTISEKVRCKLETSDFGGFSTVGQKTKLDANRAKETILSAFTVPDSSSPLAKKVKRDPSAEHGKASNTKSASSAQTKKTRPKRGQYRKYNSQLLMEAVRAVQRGEMSVHRAGSYYGVPHSTLEYKVKERHLLRQKKIKEQQQLKQQQATANGENVPETSNAEATTASTSEKKPVSKSSSPAAATDIPKISPPKSFATTPAWLPPFVSTTASPFEGAAALGLFGGGFALSTPASELLRKLQHKVQS